MSVTYNVPSVDEAMAILDRPHGINSYGDAPIYYVSAAALAAAGADVVMLAVAKTMPLPDNRNDTYEFLFEESDGRGDLVTLSKIMARSRNLPRLLETIRGALAWTHAWQIGIDTARVFVSRE